MLKREIGTLNMFTSLQSMLNKNTAVWSGDAAFSSAMGDFDSIIANLQLAVVAQSPNNTGVAKDKKNLRVEAIRQGVFIVKRVSSWATINAEKDVLIEVKYSPSSLNLATDNGLLGALTNIKNAANANLASLGAFGIDATVMTNFEAAIDAFAAQISSPKQAQQAKKEATANIKMYLKQGMALLKNRLDNDAYVFMTSAPDFYKEYTLLRKPKKPARRTRALELMVTDSLSNKPLEGVKVKIILSTSPLRSPNGDSAAGTQTSPLRETSSEKLISKRKTNKNGALWVNNLPAGKTYDIVLEKEGYSLQTISVGIVKGERKKVAVGMVKK